MTTTAITSLPTQAPCPPWCDQHSRKDFTDGPVEHHQGTLYVQRSTGIDSWITWLYVAASELQDTAMGRAAQEDEDDRAALTDMAAPGLGIAVNHGAETMPRTISPQQARELAAALIRGAEIVEAALTSECSRCGRPVIPASAAGCSQCRFDDLKARRPRLVRAEMRS